MLQLCDFPIQLGQHSPIIACRFDKTDSIDELTSFHNLVLPNSLDRAVAKRKIEFLSGRYCAREALRIIKGPTDTMITNGEDRAPIWPDGYLGSITHSHEYAAAVVASRHNFRGIGLDVEQIISEKTANNVSRQILLATENYADNCSFFPSERHYLTAIFSAKESIFKCLYPLVNKFFGFSAAEIVLSTSHTGRFQFTLKEQLTDEFFLGYQGTGQWAADDDYVYTAISLAP